MLKYSKYQKFLLSFLAFGLAIWIGGSVIRTVIAFDLFQPGTELILKNYSDDIRMQTVKLFATTSIYTEVSYAVAFVSLVLLAFGWKNHIKERGWLFMAILLFFLTSPVEFYSMFLDYRLAMNLFFGSCQIHFGDDVIQKLFVSRFKNLSIYSPMMYLAVITSIIFTIWRPLDKTLKKNTDNK